MYCTEITIFAKCTHILLINNNYAKNYILKNNTQVFITKVYLLKLEYIINSIIKIDALLNNNNGTCTQLQLVQQ